MCIQIKISNWIKQAYRNKIGYSWKCNDCNYEFKNMTHLKKHLRRKYETYAPGPGLRANYQSQSNNKKTIFQEKGNMLVIAWNIIIIKIIFFTILRRVIASWNLDNAMVKCNIKFKKIYQNNTPGPVPEYFFDISFWIL